MIDITTRIEIVEKLLEDPSKQNLTYAALECRLTIEHLCYERFKLLNSYLGESDLKNWTPANVVRQISEEIDEKIVQEIKLAFSPNTPNIDGKPTAADFEALNFQEIGMQLELKLKPIGKLWQALSNVALHIPVPTIANSELSIYGESEKIEEKVRDCIDYFRNLSGNLIIGGVMGEVFSFNCLICNTEIRRPVDSLKNPTYVHCINPKCSESYEIAPDAEGGFAFTRQTISFKCAECKGDLVVPVTQFYDMTLKHTLRVKCFACSKETEIIMRPKSRCESEENT